ncbi:MAG: hypothetical protein JW809_15545 [Pirellulales bacterium]|nr:hypothetical protein [Pirellulales bacterium]
MRITHAHQSVAFALAAILTSFCSRGVASDTPSATFNSQTGQVVLTSGPLELTIQTQGRINPRGLRDRASGQVFADRDYTWGHNEAPKMEGPPTMEALPDGGRRVALSGRLNNIVVEQIFTALADPPGAILEEITLRNPSDKPIDASSFRCGFVKQVRQGETWAPDAQIVRFCPVPYRRETNGQMQEFPLKEVVQHGVTFGGWMEPQQPTPIWGAEGWVWTMGDRTFLIAKHNPDGMEWSLMAPCVRGQDTGIRFAGAGQWKYGHPEGLTQLKAGAAYRFGPTLIQAVQGDWKQAYYAYRRWVESHGCRTPAGYNPPVHWNELYDNEFYPRACALGGQFFGTGGKGFCPEYYEANKKLQNEFYTLELMKGEAAKAKELGCEALYMDPGWEVGPSRQIWDAQRLGPMESFVKMAREEYGLKVSLWCSLGGVPPTIGDPSACPPEARTLDKDGKPVEFLTCFASPAFLDTKAKELIALARCGAAFFMFDSNQYSGPCHDRTHGHEIPSTREEHARALLELARRVKKEYPNVLIEAHDFVTGPCGIHYTPTYYGYARPHSFDCLWGHEFMWNSMDDLLSRRAVSLYYYNLAYSIPLYLHVGLKTDNEQALVFWWYASTCRHLGVGGKHPNPAVWEAQKKAMRTYLPLKRFFTQGAFYGLDEMTHAHTLADQRECVLNCFNLDDAPATKEVRFRPADIGLPAGKVEVEGALPRTDGDEIVLQMPLAARGHQLVRVKSRP